MKPYIELQYLPRRKKPAPTRALLFLALLLAFVCAGLAGCSAAEAQEPQPTAQEIKRSAAGKWLCPGMHAEWINENEVQCLKEIP